MDAQWETVVGVELHVQLDTDSKIFSGASTAYGAEPNRQACAVDLAMPGTLPVLNREVVTMAVKLGHAINAEIAPVCVFARKNY
ncbi:MAG: Asp-tRNA(Asn)/Glu-tRNA(Gln) amidotransferase GatCAB subunit B, partial [Xanthomonadales bacterium]|nr:Asp-tRNA(Asn)/Glu-tRNA(Gln) amidotransferase GatCAB subunit B [Xanthomonadales bacterium]